MMYPSPIAMEEDQKTPIGEPYVWDPAVVPPRPLLMLWDEVAKGIDKNQTGELIRRRSCASTILPSTAILRMLKSTEAELRYMCGQSHDERHSFYDDFNI